MHKGKRLVATWWRPGKKNQTFKGSILLKESNDGTLELTGRRSVLAALPPTGLVLHGIVEADYLYQVTIFDAGFTQPPPDGVSGNKIVTTELFTNIIIVGAHVRNADVEVVQGARLSLTGLREWCDSTGTTGAVARTDSGDGPDSVSISFTGSAGTWLRAGRGKELRLVSRYRGPAVFNRLKSVKFEEVDEIELRFRKAVSINDLLKEVLVWQSFLTVALRRSSSIMELRYRGSGEGAFPRQVLVPTGGEDISPPAEPLFTRSTLGTRADACLSNWATTFPKHKMAISIFAGNAFQEKPFAHSTLLAYLQALEVFHRENSGAIASISVKSPGGGQSLISAACTSISRKSWMMRRFSTHTLSSR